MHIESQIEACAFCPNSPFIWRDRQNFHTTDFYADTDWDLMAYELIFDQLKGPWQWSTTEAESGASTECTLFTPCCVEFCVMRGYSVMVVTQHRG